MFQARGEQVLTYSFIYLIIVVAVVIIGGGASWPEKHLSWGSSRLPPWVLGVNFSLLGLNDKPFYSVSRLANTENSF